MLIFRLQLRLKTGKLVKVVLIELFVEIFQFFVNGLSVCF